METTRAASPPARGGVAVLLSGTLRGFKNCAPHILEQFIKPNAELGVATYLATYTESDCGEKTNFMRRAADLTGTSVRDRVTPLPIITYRGADVNATLRAAGIQLAAMQIGPFRAADVRVPPHRFLDERLAHTRARSFTMGGLERFHSQFRLRQHALDLAAAAQQPQVAILLRPDMRPCSRWKFERVGDALWELHVRGCRWGGRGEPWAVPEAESQAFMLRPNTVVVPKSRKHPGYIDDTVAAGTFEAIRRYVGLRDALRRGAYANTSTEAIGGVSPAGKPDVFPEALLSHHLKAAGVEVLQTHFHKGDAGLWEMGNCPNELPPPGRRPAKRGGGPAKGRGRASRRGHLEQVDDCSATLVEQHSISPCVAGTNFGCSGRGSQSRLWVKQCRGVFRCAGRKAVRCDGGQYYPASQRHTCRCNGADDPALRELERASISALASAGGTPPPRVAVCMAGAARTLTRPHVRDSIARMLRTLGGARIDLFASLVLRDVEPKRQQGWAASSVDTNEGAVRAALAKLGARAVVVRNASASGSVAHNPRCPLDGWLAAKPANERRTFGQWRTVGRCVPLIEAAEAADGVQYSHIVRTRPDLFWAADHPPLGALDPAAAYYDARPLTPFAQGWHGEKPPPQADWHFFAPRAAALAAMRLYDRYLACDHAAAPFVASERALAHEHNSEAMLRASLLQHGPVRSVALPMLIVRGAARDEGAQNLLMCSAAYAQPTFGMGCDELYRAAYPS